MRRTRLWAQLLGVRGVIVGGIEVEEDDDGEIAGLIVSARLRKAEAGRCGVCRRRSGGARLLLPQATCPSGLTSTADGAVTSCSAARGQQPDAVQRGTCREGSPVTFR